MADFYAVLGLPKTASKDDIKKAYRKIALKTHPDRVAPEQKKAAEDTFRAVNAAYEILADDKNKALYDRHGVWPPPSSSGANASTSYKPRQPEYKPFGSTTQPQHPPFFDDGFQPFVFTDPFLMFKMHVPQEFFQAQAFHAAHPHSRPLRTPVPMFDGSHPQQPSIFQQQQQFQSFSQAGAFAQPSINTNTTPSKSAHKSASRPETPTISPISPKDNEDRGWIKESKVTKVTPTGTRETTVKKTTADGTVYITRIAGDGSIRHWVSINGIETPTDRGAPEVAPRTPLSQTQPQAPPPQPRPAAYSAAPPPQQQTSSRHSPSASQPVNSAYDAQAAAYGRSTAQVPSPSGPEPPRRSASRAGHHERSASRAGHHERSASRAGYPERPHRAVSPPPVPPKESKMTTPAPSPTGSYPFTYPQAPPAAAPQRVKSPSPRQEAGRTSEREREKEKDLRRNHTVPSHVLPAQAAPPSMPRPQSPHFYRTRSGSEAQNPSPVKAVPTSSATQQPRTRYDSNTGQPVRLTDEPASYVFSDTEAARARTTSSYKPSRSSNTVPAPAPQPMTQSVPTVQPGVVPPRRSSSRYGHSHSQSMQGSTNGVPTRHQSVPVPAPQQQIPMQFTNELGLGFVPPPQPGLGSNRNSGASGSTVSPNPPLGRDSRNASYEEIVYQNGPTRTKSSSRSQPSAYPNPMPNPPLYRDPSGAQQQQQARYRQAAV